MGKASTRAQNKYISKAYDRVNLTLPKGQKEEIQSYAAARGESVNGFIGRAIGETMERDMGAAPSPAPASAASAPGTGGKVVYRVPTGGRGDDGAAAAGKSTFTVTLPPEMMERVQEVLEISGETVEEYALEAIEMQISHDRVGSSSVILGSDLMRALRRPAIAAGETPQQFVARAVKAQVEKEKAAGDALQSDLLEEMEVAEAAGVHCVPHRKNSQWEI